MDTGFKGGSNSENGPLPGSRYRVNGILGLKI